MEKKCYGYKSEAETTEQQIFIFRNLSLFHSKYQMKEVYSFIFHARAHTVLLQYCFSSKHVGHKVFLVLFLF